MIKIFINHTNAINKSSVYNTIHLDWHKYIEIKGNTTPISVKEKSGGKNQKPMFITTTQISHNFKQQHILSVYD